MSTLLHPLPELVPLSQIAKEQHRDIRTLLREVAEGRLPATKFCGRWVTTREALAQRLAAILPTREAA